MTFVLNKLRCFNKYNLRILSYTKIIVNKYSTNENNSLFYVSTPIYYVNAGNYYYNYKVSIT